MTGEGAASSQSQRSLSAVVGAPAPQLLVPGAGGPRGVGSSGFFLDPSTVHSRRGRAGARGRGLRTEWGVREGEGPGGPHAVPRRGGGTLSQVTPDPGSENARGTDRDLVHAEERGGSLLSKGLSC